MKQRLVYFRVEVGTITYTGDSDAGTGGHQSGGWLYAILPYMEQNALYQASAKVRNQTPLPFMYCPSRRTCKNYRAGSPPTGFTTNDYIVKEDYAANWGGPKSGPNSKGVWPTGNHISTNAITASNFTNFYKVETYDSWGMFFCASELSSQDVYDGTSNTYLIGEKNLWPSDYETGASDGDDNSAYSGLDWDTVRDSVNSPLQDRDNVGEAHKYRFGSVHAGAFGMIFADGAVHQISYSIDPDIHKGLSCRMDEAVVTIPE